MKIGRIIVLVTFTAMRQTCGTSTAVQSRDVNLR